MRAIYNQFMSAGYDKDESMRRVDILVESIGEQDTVTLFTGYHAEFNRDTWCVDIHHMGTGEVVNSISEYVGELNHYGSSTSIMYSLVYDSMMSADAILGR